MKKKKQKRMRRLIRECEEELANIGTLPYYSLFNRRAEQEADMQALKAKIIRLKSKIANT